MIVIWNIANCNGVKIGVDADAMRNMAWHPAAMFIVHVPDGHTLPRSIIIADSNGDYRIDQALFSIFPVGVAIPGMRKIR